MKNLLFYVVLTVFQAYQDGVIVIINGYVQWKSIHSRLNPKTARSNGLHPLSDRVPYYQYRSIIAGHKATGMDLIMASSTCE